MAKKKQRKPSPTAILKYGHQGAALKAKLPPRKWRKFVRATKRRGVTVEGALSGAPTSLQERRPGAIRKEAGRLIRQSYRPVERELDDREQAVKNLAASRDQAEASYAQWLSGEYGKMEAQARAADQTLLTTQTDIANDSEALMKASAADSLQRMGQVAGSVSDPEQSTALDTSAADAASQQRIAAQRAAAAAGVGAGEDVRQVARAAMTANLSAARGASDAANRAAINDVFKQRSAVGSEKAQARAGLERELTQTNQANAQRAEEMAIAAEELGIKRLDIAASIKEADRKYKLETKKFNLDRWVARNRALTDRAKIQLGYDQIAERDGKAAADRALKKWVEKYKAKQDRLGEKDEKKGVTKEERETYSKVQTARGLIAKLNRDWREGKSGALPPSEHRQYLRTEYGIRDDLIDAAAALFHNEGVINSPVRQSLKRVGIKHIGYFYGSSNVAAGPPTPGL